MTTAQQQQQQHKTTTTEKQQNDEEEETNRQQQQQQSNQNAEQIQRRFSYEIDPEIGVIVWDVFLWYSFIFLSTTLKSSVATSGFRLRLRCWGAFFLEITMVILYQLRDQVVMKPSCTDTKLHFWASNDAYVKPLKQNWYWSVSVILCIDTFGYRFGTTGYLGCYR